MGETEDSRTASEGGVMWTLLRKFVAVMHDCEPDPLCACRPWQHTRNTFGGADLTLAYFFRTWPRRLDIPLPLWIARHFDEGTWFWEGSTCPAQGRAPVQPQAADAVREDSR